MKIKVNLLTGKLFIIICTISLQLNAQNFKVEKIEPPNWWINMKLNSIQLMIYGEALDNVSAAFENNNIRIEKIHHVKNPSYLFIDIEIPHTLTPGTYRLLFNKDDQTIAVDYDILLREDAANRFGGFGQEDVVYLIMPDRFANGDPSNDVIEGFIDGVDRSNPSMRHGGDLQGVIDKLDYLANLGITAIWLNPVVENNTRVSYHGYAATDLYKIDARLGTNELFRKLVEEAHKRNIKIIYDHVANHISINHPWLNNLPAEDWLNGTAENHIVTNHRKFSLSDPYADSSVIKANVDGWFTHYMPDLNQRNPFVAKYLTQNMIWWIEYTGLDGIREDTYPYADQKFMADWAKTILEEYPSLNIVGEIWDNDPVFASYYQHGSKVRKGFDSHLPSVMDFALYTAFYDYLKGKTGMYKFYEHFAKDFIYADPTNLMTFADNHDIERAIFSANGDIDKLKIVFTLLLTTRGIPQILYATEIGMMGGKSHGELREDFPGGFQGDERNAFIEEGRTEKENEIFDFLKELISLRNQYRSLSSGKMIHLPPKDEVYIYFKILDDEKTVVIINNNSEEKSVKLNLNLNVFQDVKGLKNLWIGEITHFENEEDLKLNKYEVIIFKLLE